MVTSPTRGQNILDLFFTSNPTVVNKVTVIPGLSDHDIVLAAVNSRPELIKQGPCDILLYKKADWDLLSQTWTGARRPVPRLWIRSAEVRG